MFIRVQNEQKDRPRVQIVRQFQLWLQAIDRNYVDTIISRE